MSEFRGFLQRINVRPDPDDLTAAEWKHIQEHFDIHAGEVLIDGFPVRWDFIEEIEVVKAARVAGPSGWLVKQFVGDDRYHVGIYYGAHEAVLPNISLKAAQFVVQSIAYYAPNPIRYSGVEGLSPIKS